MTELTAAQIVKLTAIITGEQPKRAATKDAAIARFEKAAAACGIDGQEILARNDYDACAAALSSDVDAEQAEAERAAAEARDQRIVEFANNYISPGIARLRSNPKAEAIRQSVLSDAEAVMNGQNPFEKRKTRRAALDVIEAATPAAEVASAKPVKAKKAKSVKPARETGTRKPKADYKAVFAMLQTGATHKQVCEYTGWPRGYNRMRKIADKNGCKLEKRGEVYFAVAL